MDPDGAGLYQAFSKSFEAQGHALDVGVDEVTGALQRQVEAGIAAWPGLPASRLDFSEHVGRVLNVDELPLAEAIERLHAADLYLAFACAMGLPPAIATFYERYRPTLERTLARFRLSEAATADLCHAVVERLVYSRPPTPPGLARYAGRGPLGAWLAVVAKRAALDELAVHGVAVAHETPDAHWLRCADDPELEVLRQRHQAELARALRTALASLDKRQRTILRLSVVESLPQEGIARLYRVNRSTVCRWLADAHDILLTRVRAELKDRQRISDDDLGSLVRLLGSQINMGLSALDESALALKT